jgi:hypothetical protein
VRFIVDAEAAPREYVQADNGVHSVKERQVSDVRRNRVGAQWAKTDAWQQGSLGTAPLSERHDFAPLDVHVELLRHPAIHHAGDGTRINQEIQPFEPPDDTTSDDLISLAQLEFERTPTRVAGRVGWSAPMFRSKLVGEGHRRRALGL